MSNVLEVVIKAKNLMASGITSAKKEFDDLGKKSLDVTRNIASGFATATKAVVAIGASIVGATAYFVKAAMDAAEMESRFDALFKSSSDDVRAWSETLADAVNRSGQDIRNTASDFEGFFVGLGYSTEEAAKFSKQLTELSVDFASFNNLADSEASGRFISALSGSGEVLDRFGINIKSAALEQKLFEMGINKTTAQASEQEKAIARLAIITESMGAQGAVGDAVRTSGSLSNQWRGLTAALQDGRREIGAAIMDSGGLADITGKVTAKVREAIGEWRTWVDAGGMDVKIKELSLFTAEYIANIKIMSAYGEAYGKLLYDGFMTPFRYLGNILGSTAAYIITLYEAIADASSAVMDKIKNPFSEYVAPSSAELEAASDQFFAAFAENPTRGTGLDVAVVASEKSAAAKEQEAKAVADATARYDRSVQERAQKDLEASNKATGADTIEDLGEQQADIDAKNAEAQATLKADEAAKLAAEEAEMGAARVASEAEQKAAEMASIAEAEAEADKARIEANTDQELAAVETLAAARREAFAQTGGGTSGTLPGVGALTITPEDTTKYGMLEIDRAIKAQAELVAQIAEAMTNNEAVMAQTEILSQIEANTAVMAETLRTASAMS
jgi:hypothetical protein